MTLDITKIGGVLERVKTPLTLGGLAVIVLYEIYSQILQHFPQIAQESAATIVLVMVRYLFWLAVIAVVLGAGSYLAHHFMTRLHPPDPEPKFEPVNRTDKKL